MLDSVYLIEHNVYLTFSCMSEWIFINCKLMELCWSVVYADLPKLFGVNDAKEDYYHYNNYQC